jgi:hypothetical protein
LLIKAASYASSQGHISGTTNWGAAMSAYLRHESKAAAQPAPVQEPVACVIDGDLYFHHEIDWEDLAYQGHGVELLYTTPPAQPAPVPKGWKMVPMEPTREMWTAVNKLDDQCAAGNYDGKGCSIEQAWNCLLDAAPTPPAAQRQCERGNT